MQTVTALAAGVAAWTPEESSALADALARAEQALPSLGLREEAGLALALHAIHGRIGQSLAGARGSAGDAARKQALSARLVQLLALIEARAARRYPFERARIAAGGLRGAELVAWIGQHPAEERDLAVEQLLGVARPALDEPRLGPELVGYIPSGVAPVVQAVRRARIGPDDVVVDVGAGLGKAALLMHLLTGARVRGIELQPELVVAARQRAAALGIDAIVYEQGDARFVDFSGASVVYLYLPFTGATLSAVLERIEAAAGQRELVVCTLGLDLPPRAWLRERPGDELWLSIYDSVTPGARPARPRPPPPLGDAAEDVATER